ncbi:MAG: hypothetical protein JRI68_02225 [Deltaproteobacteria bacterium]|nr:hypothetical protein [Deltaproteobacteria bacterium]
MSGWLRAVVIGSLPLLCGCTSLSGIDDKVFDLADAGAGEQDGGGGAGADGGDGGDAFDGGSCSDPVLVFTESAFQQVVPDKMHYLHAKAWGAGGNTECNHIPDDGAGGVGGFTEAIFAVNPGEPLIVIVGGRRLAALTPQEQIDFGFPGRGAGGLSGVFEGPPPLGEGDQLRALIIAGGGGGAGVDAPDGGATGNDCHPGGTGNHTDSGGAGSMLGENGDEDINSGGGGYQGGKAGDMQSQDEADWGGFGGTGYVRAGALSERMGSVERSAPLPPGSDDEDWEPPAGVQEKPGRVVLRFYCSQPETW